MMDKLLGVSLIVVAFAWMGNAVCDRLIKNPNWTGAVLALLAIVPGCLIIASIVRDRL